MNTGKTLFAQLMDFLPWTTFTRIVGRYDDDRAIRTLSCTKQFRVMAFAQLTYRESLRDIEACLSAPPRSSITWAFVNRCAARRWQMPMRAGIGASMPSSPSG